VLRIYGLPRENRAAAARFLADQGFHAVVVGADETAAGVRPALDAGLAVWACRPAFSVRGLPEDEAEPLLARDPDGTPRPWFSSGCPNQPALRAAHLALIEQLARSGAFAGLMLDGIRFASPNAGPGFFTCFCAACRAKAAALGYDFETMRRAALALRDHGRSSAQPLAETPAHVAEAIARWPGAAAWLRFRAACVAEHVSEVCATVDRLNAQMGVPFQLGAYLFTPSFAPLVGQDYQRLAPLLDVVSPMIYRTLEGDSCLTAEWRALARLRLVPERASFSPGDVAAEVVRSQRSSGRHPFLESGARLVPILQLADDLLAETSRAALGAGAAGLDYFLFRAGSEPAAARAARIFATASQLAHNTHPTTP
jgi:hypothetical protein